MTKLKRSLLPVLLAACFTLLGGLLTLSARAGSFETRVSALEASRAADSAKLDRILDIVQATRESMAAMRAQLDRK